MESKDLQDKVDYDRRKLDKWKMIGKGRGNRWLMLRDLIAFLSLRPMSMTLIQDTMLLHKGLKRTTIREMIDQLMRTKSVEQIQDQTGPIMQWVYVATEGGVNYWLNSRKDIPASIAKAAWTMKSVDRSGVIENEDS